MVKLAASKSMVISLKQVYLSCLHTCTWMLIKITTAKVRIKYVYLSS